MQGKPVKSKVIINSIDCTNYIRSYSIKDTEGEEYIKNCVIILDKSVETVLTLSSLNTKSVTIQRGVTDTEKYIFRGEITHFRPDGGTIELTCADKLIQTTKRTITKSFDKAIDSESGVLSAIFTTLITYTDLTASVTNSGTTTTLTKFICRAETVYSKLKELATALGWIFYYDPNEDKVYFEPFGNVNNSTNLESGVNILKSPKWVYDSTNLINSVEVRGANQLIETTESGQIGVTNGFTTNDILLGFEPVSSKVYCDSSNPPTTLKTGGKSGVTSTYDYSVDQENKKIVWNDTFTPGASDYVQIDYTYALPTPVLVEDTTSISNYTKKEKVLQIKNTKLVDDAYVFAQQYINDFSEPLLTTKIEVTDISDLAVGQQVRIIDTVNDIDTTLKINSIEMTYPYSKDIITVGSFVNKIENLLFNVIARINSLEETELGESELLTHYFQSINNINYENRYVKLINNKDSLILDHSTRGKLDLNKTGGGINEYWNTDWRNYKQITVNSVETITDYSLLITVDWNSNMNIDFSDLRFVSKSGEILNYWIESKTNSDTAEIWVKTDLKIGDNIINMYYNSATATSVSDITSTFLFGNDYTGTDPYTLDSWGTGVITTFDSKSVYKMEPNSAVYITLSVEENVDIINRVYLVSEMQNLYTCYLTSPFATSAEQGYLWKIGGGDVRKLYTTNNGMTQVAVDDRGIALETWTTVRCEKQNQDADFRLITNNQTLSAEDETNYTNLDTFEMMCTQGDDFTYIDYTFIKKHIGTEPTYSFGIEINSNPIILTPGNNEFKEYVYDDEFYSNDSTNTTFGTTNKEITIGTVGTFITKPISIGFNWDKFKLSVGSVNGGTLDYAVSGDNGNTWDTATLNSYTSFSVGTVSTFKLKITNTGTEAIIENTYLNGKYVNPALQLKLKNS